MIAWKRHLLGKLELKYGNILVLVDFQRGLKHSRVSILAGNILLATIFRAFLAGKQRIKFKLKGILFHHFKLQMNSFRNKTSQIRHTSKILSLGTPDWVRYVKWHHSNVVGGVCLYNCFNRNGKLWLCFIHFQNEHIILSNINLWKKRYEY